MSLPILLFAAGKGTRMAPLTDTMPKPLIPVAGKPLIDHALDFVRDAGLGPVVVNLHYKGQMIRDHLQGQNITFSDEPTLLETGGGLRKALPLLGPGPVVTMNTDAVWQGPNPLTTVLGAWDDRMEALLLTIPKSQVHGHLGAGDFDIDGTGHLTRGTGSVYSGVQIMRPEVLEEIDEEKFSLNRAWDRIAARDGLCGTLYAGQWCDVGQPASIPLAEAMCHV